MSLYIPGKGREYQQISSDSNLIRQVCIENRVSGHPGLLLEHLSLEGSVIEPKNYESYWGSEIIEKKESVRPLTDTIIDLFAEAESKRKLRQADIALIQDLKLEVTRSYSDASARLMLLNRK